LARLATLSLAGVAWLFAACAQTHPPGVDEEPRAPTDSTQPSLRVIYLIHGDGDYAWHDSSGMKHLADRDALRQALAASGRTHGESFVFHLKSQTPLFGKASDGTWYHYRDGKILGQGRYAAKPGDSALSAEARVLRRLGGDVEGPRVLLAWFGHEIPLQEAAYGEGTFGVPSFARGLSRLQPRVDASKPYALLVLSACYGGNPATIRALAPLAGRIVASPAYLHLSHLDISAFGDSLASDPSEEAVARLTDTVAARSFARLTALARTEVTVATYDAARVTSFLSTTTEATGSGVRTRASAVRGWADCAEVAPGFDSGLAAQGTRLLYRPPEFGAGKDRARRSAWQCART
jgi:hypothetical protein